MPPGNSSLRTIFLSKVGFLMARRAECRQKTVFPVVVSKAYCLCVLCVSCYFPFSSSEIIAVPVFSFATQHALANLWVCQVVFSSCSAKEC